MSENADTSADDAGEPACLFDRVCPECGALDGHRVGCGPSE